MSRLKGKKKSTRPVFTLLSIIHVVFSRSYFTRWLNLTFTTHFSSVCLIYSCLTQWFPTFLKMTLDNPQRTSESITFKDDGGSEITRGFPVDKTWNEPFTLNSEQYVFWLLDRFLPARLLVAKWGVCSLILRDWHQNLTYHWFLSVFPISWNDAASSGFS